MTTYQQSLKISDKPSACSGNVNKKLNKLTSDDYLKGETSSSFAEQNSYNGNTVSQEVSYENLKKLNEKSVSIWLSNCFDKKQINEWCSVLNYWNRRGGYFPTWLDREKSITIEEWKKIPKNKQEKLTEDFAEILKNNGFSFCGYCDKLVKKKSLLRANEIFDLFCSKECYQMINDVRTLEISQQNFSSGHLNLSKFANLEELYLWRNYSDSLILTNASKLKHLNCSENDLISLDCSDLKKLKRVVTKNNKLTNIKLPNENELSLINVKGNKLTLFNFSSLSDLLTSLNLSNNNLRSIDIDVFSCLTKLEFLDIGCWWKKGDKEENKHKFNNFTGSLASLESCTKLKFLSISNTNIDSGLEYLPESLETFFFSSYNERKCGVNKIEVQLKKQLFPNEIYNKKNWKIYWRRVKKQTKFKLLNQTEQKTDDENKSSKEFSKEIKELVDLAGIESTGNKLEKAEWDFASLEEEFRIDVESFNIYRQLNDSIKQKDERIMELQNKLNNYEYEKAKLEEKIEREEKTNENLRNEVNSLGQQINQLKKGLENNEKKIDLLVELKKIKNSELDKKEKELDLAKKEKEELEKEIINLKNKLQLEMQERESQIQYLRGQLSQLKKDYEVKKEQSTKNTIELERERKKLVSENVILQGQLESNKNEQKVQSIQSKIKDKELEIYKLDQQINSEERFSEKLQEFFDYQLGIQEVFEINKQ